MTLNYDHDVQSISLISKNEQQIIKFKLNILINRPSIPSDYDRGKIDIDNGCIVVSPKIVHHNSGYFQNLSEYDWVRVYLVFDASKTRTISNCGRLVQLVYNEFIQDDNLVYVSPQLWFNLLFQPFKGSLELIFWQYPLEQKDTRIVVRIFYFIIL